jgi:hypothetical protein
MTKITTPICTKTKANNNRSGEDKAMNQVTDKDGLSNPYQATTIADLITPDQLHWLTVAAESVNADKEETAIALFNCSVFSLSRTAAVELEQHFARLKMNEHQRHEHDCALCGDTFACSQTLCNASLARYCHDCTADLFGAILDTQEVTTHAC